MIIFWGLLILGICFIGLYYLTHKDYVAFQILGFVFSILFFICTLIYGSIWGNNNQVIKDYQEIKRTNDLFYYNNIKYDDKMISELYEINKKIIDTKEVYSGYWEFLCPTKLETLELLKRK